MCSSNSNVNKLISEIALSKTEAEAAIEKYSRQFTKKARRLVSGTFSRSLSANATIQWVHTCWNKTQLLQ